MDVNMLTLLLSLVGVIIGIIILSLNLSFYDLSHTLYKINLSRRIKKQDWNDNFYYTFYNVLKQSQYDPESGKYLITKDKIFDIIKYVEHLPNDPRIEIILNSRFDFFKQMKLLSKKDSSTFMVSNEFDKINRQIHNDERGDNLV
jgi:hypothetical protein